MPPLRKPTPTEIAMLVFLQPKLREYSIDKITEYQQLLQRFAPTIAQIDRVAARWIMTAIVNDNVSPADMRHLAECEKQLREVDTRGNMMNAADSFTAGARWAERWLAIGGPISTPSIDEAFDRYWETPAVIDDIKITHPPAPAPAPKVRGRGLEDPLRLDPGIQPKKET